MISAVDVDSVVSDALSASGCTHETVAPRSAAILSLVVSALAEKMEKKTDALSHSQHTGVVVNQVAELRLLCPGKHIGNRRAQQWLLVNTTAYSEAGAL